MEIANGVAELINREPHTRLRTLECRQVAGASFSKLLAGGQEVLQRVVVERIGDALLGALLGVDRLGDQYAARVSELKDPATAVCEQRRQHDCRDADPHDVHGSGHGDACLVVRASRGERMPSRRTRLR